MTPTDVAALLRDYIRDIPDFPKPGILFRDITPLLADAAALKRAIQAIAEPFREAGVERVLGTEARGFIFGTAVALELGAGFVPARKPGKLPHTTVAASYQLEYGTDSIEMHTDALRPGQRVLLVDDLIATGGTARATAELARSSGAELIGCAFLIELSDLRGRDALDVEHIHSVVVY